MVSIICHANFEDFNVPAFDHPTIIRYHKYNVFCSHTLEVAPQSRYSNGVHCLNLLYHAIIKALLQVILPHLYLTLCSRHMYGKGYRSNQNLNIDDASKG